MSYSGDRLCVHSFGATLNKPFDKPRTNGKWLISFVGALRCHSGRACRTTRQTNWFSVSLVNQLDLESGDLGLF